MPFRAAAGAKALRPQARWGAQGGAWGMGWDFTRATGWGLAGARGTGPCCLRVFSMRAKVREEEQQKDPPKQGKGSSR